MELQPARAVVEAMGVGYELNISLSTFSAIDKQPTVKLYVYEQIREDAWLLFGFATKAERSLFLHLISVSGVGGNTARTILSSYSVSELCSIIVDKQDGMLKRVKGIGGKTAQRIIVELEDKLRNSDLMFSGDSMQDIGGKQTNTLTAEAEEAIAALTMLGFSPAPTKKVVKQLVEQEPGLSAENIIKKALKMM